MFSAMRMQHSRNAYAFGFFFPLFASYDLTKSPFAKNVSYVKRQESTSTRYRVQKEYVIERWTDSFVLSHPIFGVTPVTNTNLIYMRRILRILRAVCGEAFTDSVLRAPGSPIALLGARMNPAWKQDCGTRWQASLQDWGRFKESR